MALRGLVILDGPDAVGKTTLAKELLRRTGEAGVDGYIHNTWDPGWTPDPDTVWCRNLTAALLKAAIRLAQGKLTVIDRHWMSEETYAKVYRTRSSITAESRAFDRVVHRLGGVYVICAPGDIPRAVENFHRMASERSELYAPDERMGTVLQRYLDLWGGREATGLAEPFDYVDQITARGGLVGKPYALRYDMFDHGAYMDETFSMVAGCLRDRLAGQFPFALEDWRVAGSFLGHRSTGETVFVFEKPLLSGAVVSRWPFVNRLRSSVFLSNQLHVAGFDEAKGLWISSSCRAGMEQVAQAPGVKRVIAFGYEAEKAAKEFFPRELVREVFSPGEAVKYSQENAFGQELQEALR